MDFALLTLHIYQWSQTLCNSKTVAGIMLIINRNRVLLEYNCFKMLCQFLLYNEVNQLYVYIYSVPLEPPISISSHQSRLPQSTKLSSLCYARNRLLKRLSGQGNAEEQSHVKTLSWKLQKIIKFLDLCIKITVILPKIY